MTSSFPIITTQRLVLRQPSALDAPQIFTLRTDANVNKYLDRKPCSTLDEAAAFILAVNENFFQGAGYYWAICDEQDGQVIGTICLFELAADGSACEVGYELLPGYQGKGLMREALEQVIAFAFKRLQVKSINAFSHKDNLASAGLLQKSGFTKLESPAGSPDPLTAFRLLKMPA